MDERPKRRLWESVLHMFGKPGKVGEWSDRSAFLASEAVRRKKQRPAEEEFVEPIWSAPNGQIMHARWKGANATVWWPLKEDVRTMVIRRVNAEATLCVSGEALYEFWTPALLQFVAPQDLERAGRMQDLADRLRVQVAEYQIVGALLVPREQARKKGIA